MSYECFKISQTITMVKKLNKIKNIINTTIRERLDRVDILPINELEKKKITKELDKKLTLVKNKYNIIHEKLYNIINILMSCECCVRNDMICKGGIMCLKPKENEEIWIEMDSLFDKIINFYEEVETKLVIELELCLHKINKIKKISYLIA